MYDVCIIGGGINGVSAAYELASRNYKVILFEQKKLGNGASSKTSKLAHGGLRYLENLEFGLVRESLQERNRLINEYPNLVKPMPFVFPVYTNYSTVKMWMGMKLYDRFAKGSPMPNSKKITIEEVKLNTSWLDTTNMKSAYLYYDAVMNDKDLLIEVANKARDKKAELFSEEEVLGVNKKPGHLKIGTTKRVVKAKVVINVTGAWNKELTKPTKGVHLITNKLVSKTATILINPNDKRVFFTIPYNKQTIIGTTDDIYEGDPNKVTITDHDRNYIVDAVNNFTIENLSHDDIVGEYAGLRPLARSDKEVGKVSRDFVIQEDDRVFSMVGGKFTTHRLMAEQLVNEIEEHKYF